MCPQNNENILHPNIIEGCSKQVKTPSESRANAKPPQAVFVFISERKSLLF
jgi:hypothetical protein